MYTYTHKFWLLHDPSNTAEIFPTNESDWDVQTSLTSERAGKSNWDFILLFPISVQDLYSCLNPRSFWTTLVVITTFINCPSLWDQNLFQVQTCLILFLTRNLLEIVCFFSSALVGVLKGAVSSANLAWHYSRRVSVKQVTFSNLKEPQP